MLGGGTYLSNPVPLPFLTILYFVGHTVDMPTIVHFDIPAEDVERSQKFYTELFGWK
jgi:hypothetical protein